MTQTPDRHAGRPLVAAVTWLLIAASISVPTAAASTGGAVDGMSGAPSQPVSYAYDVWFHTFRGDVRACRPCWRSPNGEPNAQPRSHGRSLVCSDGLCYRKRTGGALIGCSETVLEVVSEMDAADVFQVKKVGQ